MSKDKNPKNKKPKNKDNKKVPIYKQKSFYMVLGVLFILLLIGRQLESNFYYSKMSVNHLEYMIETKSIDKIIYNEATKEVEYKVNKKGIEQSREFYYQEKKKEDSKLKKDDVALRQAIMSSGMFKTKVPNNYFAVSSNTYKKLMTANTKLEIVSSGNVSSIINGLFSLGILILIAYSVLSMMGGLTKNNLEQINDTKYRFKDIGGLNTVKKELQHIVYMLKNRDNVKEFVDKIPKGILFEGAPGNGKTLLAKALAGEAGVMFFYISASDIEGKFVGEGANRIASIFKEIHEAIKENGAAILFIDELDAVGINRNKRTVSETNQTLNKLLTELDGFNDSSNLLVIGATNLASSLDPALVRSGRFDRIITIPNPNERDRKAILKLYLDKHKEKIEPSVFDGDFLDILSLQTSGFSSSDLSRVVSDSLLICLTEDIESQQATTSNEMTKEKTLKENEQELSKTIESNTKKLVNEKHIRESYLRVVMGLPVERETADSTLQIVAYHEAAHAIIAMATSTDGYNAVAYGTIRPYGNAGGFIHFVQSTKRLTRKSDYEARILTLLAGRTIEEMVLDGDITDGASNDLEQVRKVIESYVSKVGMSEGLENFYNEKADTTKVSVAVDELLIYFTDKCRELVAQHYAEIENLAHYFYAGNDLDRKDIVERYQHVFPAKQLKLVGNLQLETTEPLVNETE